MKFKHYIITRMNVGIYDQPKSKEWMEHRIELFEKYTLPSILRQTNKNFTWVLCFDERTPNDIICKYDYLDNVEIFWDRPKYWMKTKPPETDWVITSRIDNDDYYYPNFVEDIQREFINRKMEMVIDIGFLILDEKTGNVYDLEKPLYNSPFITLCEWWHTAEGVMVHEHTRAANLYKGYIIPKYLAVQVVHEMNVINHVRGKKVDI